MNRRPWLPWAALVVVYLAWGSTYLAIRVGVRHLPPLTFAGVRYALSGVILLPVALRTGTTGQRQADKPGRRQWAAAALIGILLLVCGNGGVTVAEQRISSGLAALLVATVPLWMALASRVLYGVRIGPVGLLALALGIVGVGLLVRPGPGGSVASELLVVGAAACWGFGSVLAPHLPLPRRAMLTSALEMLAGAGVLLVAGAARGEFARIHHIDAESLWALAFLVVVGSILAFSCYSYALSTLPASVVSTYAYVNPLVAVGLGGLLLSERLDGTDVIGACLVVAAVAALVASRSRARRAAEPTP